MCSRRPPVTEEQTWLRGWSPSSPPLPRTEPGGALLPCAVGSGWAAHRVISHEVMSRNPPVI